MGTSAGRHRGLGAAILAQARLDGSAKCLYHPRVQPTWIQRHRLLTLVGALAVVAWAAWQLPYLRFDFSPQHLFELDDEDPRTRLWQRSIRAFGRGDNLLFVVAESTRPGGALEDAARAHLRELEAALAPQPYTQALISVDSLALPVADGEDLRVARGRELQAAELLAHPLVRGHLASADGRLSALVLTIADSHRRVEALTTVVEEVEAWIASHPAPPGLRLGLTGVPFVRVDVVRTLVADQLRFIPLTALLVGLVLLLALRDTWRTLLPLLTVCAAALVAVGAAVQSGTPVDIVNQILPVLILVIAVSDGLHLVARYEDELRLGRPPATALAVTVRRLALACLITSLTTAAGLASLASMQTPVIRRFGLLAALGVVLAYALTLTLLPAALALAPTRPPRGAGTPHLARLALRLGRIGMRWPRAVLGCGLLLGLGAGGLGLWRVHADIHVIDYLPSDDEKRARLHRVEQQLGGVLSMELLLELEGELKPSDPRLLVRLRALQTEVLAIPGVTSALGPIDLLQALHRAVAGADAPAPDAAALAQLWLLAELAGPDLAFGRFVGEDGRLLRVALRLLDVGGRGSLDIARRIEAAGARAFGDLPGVRVHATGDAESVSRHIIVVIRDLYRSLALASAAIFVCLLVVFRSWRLALLAVPPNLLPLVCSAGFMGALGLDLDISTVVIFSVALGLAVDDTVHVLARVREESAAGGSWREVIERSLLGSGNAVFLTSLVLGAGMLLLLLGSSFTPTRLFGLLTFVTLLSALLADLLLLPALLVLFPPRRR